jgi:hypothetical protein
VTTCLLTATELGKPVYTKAGFRTITEYVFLNREKPWQEQRLSMNIMDYQKEYNQQVLKLDRKATAENREQLLTGFIHDAKLYAVNNTILGCYIPGLKEGLVIAETPEAGFELLKIKCPIADRIVLPAENHTGIDFLKQHGFV